MKNTFIAVEGVIGAGKTSLSKFLSEKHHFHLLKEIVEENPFLGKFYENIEEWSFQTEMFFLCNRYKQLNDIKKDYLDKDLSVVADYHIFKNKIFSNMTLDRNHLIKYNQVFDILTADMPEPNLVLYIKVDLETALKRISIRGRDIEKNIDPMYMNELIERYNLFMDEFKSNYPDIPLLVIDGNTLDFVNNQDDLDYIFTKVDKYLYSKK
jgi:deoxyguanosine kinase